MDEKKTTDYDLFNNPMVDAAKKAMSPDQINDYKRMGKYMYSTNFQVREQGSIDKPPQLEDIVGYATEGLKAGLDPRDLSEKELQSLIDLYGEKWYEKFDYEENEVPKPVVQVIQPKKMSRQERRHNQRRKKK